MATTINEVLVIRFAGLTNAGMTFTATRALRIFDAKFVCTAVNGGAASVITVASGLNTCITNTTPNPAVATNTYRTGETGGAGLTASTLDTTRMAVAAAGTIVADIDVANTTANLNVFCYPT